GELARGITLVGAGIPSPYGSLEGEKGLTRHGTSLSSFKYGASVLFWDGKADENLLTFRGTVGFALRDLSLIGNDRVKVLVAIDSIPNFGSGLAEFQRVLFARADCAMECGGQGPNMNAADMSFIDVQVFDCQTGFRTCQYENVDYYFLRPMFMGCGTALHFKRGGSAEVTAMATRRTALICAIDGANMAHGNFHFSGLRVDVNAAVRTNVISEDGRWDRPEPPNAVVLKAKGEANVKFTALNVVGRKQAIDSTTPLFFLDSHVQVCVESSMLTGPVAILRGAGKAAPTWIQFDQCRFRINSDPRKSIQLDEYSGFELRNCQITTEEDPASGKWDNTETEFVSSLVRLPGKLSWTLKEK
ncbi:MAG: hypothetical protein JNM63_01170, partial [Spirochaetia bacterium]|nr:hypothetical protein [Spirochaetia bacterium]